MKYKVLPTKIFLEQLQELTDKSVRIIRDKINILGQNPFHFKKLVGYNLFLFRIRFEDNRKEKRIVYLVEKNEVTLLFILDRDKEYKDLEKYIRKVGNLK